MSIFFRLSLVSVLILIALGISSAQAAPETRSTAVQPVDLAQPAFSATFSPQLSQFSPPHVWLPTGPDLLDQSVCLKMRVYKLARDGPNTDSTHPVGYTTCSPAARFATHSAVLTEPASKR